MNIVTLFMLLEDKGERQNGEGKGVERRRGRARRAQEGREGEREGGRKGGREREREGGRERGREEEREGEREEEEHLFLLVLHKWCCYDICNKQEIDHRVEHSEGHRVLVLLDKVVCISRW